LGLGLLAFSRALLKHSDFSNLIRPKLVEMSTRHSVTAFAAEAPDLKLMTVIALASPPTTLRLHIDIGSRLTALTTSIGRCLAAFGGYGWDDIEKQFRETPWDNAPPFKTWKKQVELTQKRGYDVDCEYIAGLTMMAVPVLGPDRAMSHVIATIDITSQLDKAGRLALVADMKTAARSVAE
jgi:DNA-binding IclR family transcriptional regulator